MVTIVYPRITSKADRAMPHVAGKMLVPVIERHASEVIEERRKAGTTLEHEISPEWSQNETPLLMKVRIKFKKRWFSALKATKSA